MFNKAVNTRNQWENLGHASRFNFGSSEENKNHHRWVFKLEQRRIRWISVRPLLNDEGEPSFDRTGFPSFPPSCLGDQARPKSKKHQKGNHGRIWGQVWIDWAIVVRNLEICWIRKQLWKLFVSNQECGYPRPLEKSFDLVSKWRERSEVSWIKSVHLHVLVS